MTERKPSPHAISRRRLLAGAAAVVASGGPARAQAFPSGPVQIVTSVGPGAAPDVITRLLAEQLTRHWGQQVIVLNRPGGAGAVAIKAVAPAASDGHTLYMSLASNFIALPELQSNFPVDVLRDFVPIGFIGEHPLVVAAAPTLGVNTLPELIALLKSKPGELNISAGNRGSIIHLAAEWFRTATGTKFTIVHYAGGAQAMPDLLGGRIQAVFDAIPSMSGPIDGGQVKPLAVTSKKRLANFSQIPAVAETIPGYEAMGWMALMAPPGTPQAIAQKISDDVKTVQALPEMKKRVEDLGNYTRPTSPAELTAFIREQVQIWRPVIAETAKAIK
jgi:tripartite-type tricarboxylate transporter receptor subunit TctC